MDKYGSDKPDLRIDLSVTDVTELLADCGFGPFEGNVVKAVPISNCALTRKQIDKLLGRRGGAERQQGLLVQDRRRPGTSPAAWPSSSRTRKRS